MSQHTSPRWTGRSQGSPLGNRIFMALIRHAGLTPAYALLFFVAWWYACTDRASSHWIRDFRRRLALPTRRIDLFRHYRSFGMSLIDRFAFLAGKRAPFGYTCIREQSIAAEAHRGRGVILLSAHVGNWELAGNLLSDRIGATINVIAYDNESAAIRRIFDAALQARRIKVITVSRDAAADVSVQIVKALRAGEIVCLHGDRILDQRSATVDFLGAPARFPVGPYALAAIAGCPIIPVFVVKTGTRDYTFQAFDPIRFDDVSRDNRDRAITNGLATFARILEQVVRDHPGEWHNFYGFWEGEEVRSAELGMRNEEPPDSERRRSCIES